MSNPLDTKMFGRTLADWAPMTPQQRSADSRIRGAANKLKALQEAIDAATRKLADAAARPPQAETPSPQGGEGGGEGGGAPQPAPASPEVTSAANETPATNTDPASPAVGEQLIGTIETMDGVPRPGEQLGPEDIEPCRDEKTAVTLDDVVRHLDEHPNDAQARTRLMEIRLTPEQANRQAQLFAALGCLGVKLRRPGDVYGWLLDQLHDATTR